MDRLAPKPVLDSLSKATIDLLYQRLTPDHRLRPYINLSQYVRIRGLKPSIQYATYSILNEQRELVPMYEVGAEEEQTAWVNAKRQSIVTDLNEADWCVWEDRFFETGHAPLLHPSSYVDVMGNTQAHLLAYACLNNRFTDVAAYDAQFQAIQFQSNPALQHRNERQETPLAIMMGNADLHEFVESLLLRISHVKRCPSLSFRYWQEHWSTLMRDTPVDLLLLDQSNTPNFLNRYRRMTYNNVEALHHLFAAGYRLKPNDSLRDCKATVSEALIRYPSWHNISFWLYLYSETHPRDQFLKRTRLFIEARNSIIRDEILSIVFHPSRIAKYTALGYQMGDFAAIF